MENNDFTIAIPVTIGGDEAIKKINNLPGWWGVGFSGVSENLHDEFVVKMGGESYFNFTVAELISNKRVVWLVTDCYMPWYEDKKEWANTKLVFDLSESEGVTTLKFTHEGLVPTIACYKDCEKGWTHWITRSLSSYFTTGVGDFKQR